MSESLTEASLPSHSAEAVRALALTLNVGLIALVFLWQLSVGASLGRFILAALLTLPLWAPISGLVRRNRRTYAWATLCVIPCFILGTTEAIANPATRAWSGTCLAMALILIVALIGYLRLTRATSTRPTVTS